MLIKKIPPKKANKKKVLFTKAYKVKPLKIA